MPFRISIFSDSHLGHKGKDEFRKHDSFYAYEECLYLSNYNECDIILHGGDLFDTSNPNQSITKRFNHITSHYVFGANDTKVKCPQNTDERPYFHGLYDKKTLNFEEPGGSVALPFFAIHGNHDDPVGLERTSPLHTASCARLINYFGGVNNEDEDIHITPLILEKDGVKVAIYAIGYLKEGRFWSLLTSNRLIFAPPPDNCYSILVIHENVKKRTIKMKNDFEKLIAQCSFLDFIICGHEHYSTINEDYTTPLLIPGSPVRTSFNSDELGDKNMFILEIDLLEEDGVVAPAGRLRSRRLFHVRPVVFFEETVTLGEHEQMKIVRDVLISHMQDHLDTQQSGELNELRVATAKRDVEIGLSLDQDHDISNFAACLSGIESHSLMVPLARYKVRLPYGKAPMARDFGQVFTNLVANPEKILQVISRKHRSVADSKTRRGEWITQADDNRSAVEDFLVHRILQRQESSDLDPYSILDFSSSVRCFSSFISGGTDDYASVAEEAGKALRRSIFQHINQENPEELGKPEIFNLLTNFAADRNQQFVESFSTMSVAASDTESVTVTAPTIEGTVPAQPRRRRTRTTQQHEVADVSMLSHVPSQSLRMDRKKRTASSSTAARSKRSVRKKKQTTLFDFATGTTPNPMAGRSRKGPIEIESDSDDDFVLPSTLIATNELLDVDRTQTQEASSRPTIPFDSYMEAESTDEEFIPQAISSSRIPVIAQKKKSSKKKKSSPNAVLSRFAKK
ncbi:hypothetical protein PCE1_000121 [Barthelona sp. PCE]